MGQSPEAILTSLGLTLPSSTPPAGAAYVPYVVTGNQVFISGQLPMGFGELQAHAGQLGSNYTLEQGIETAKICTLNVISHVKAACGGDLSKVKRCVKLVVFVNSAANFTDQPKIANGASELIKQVFGKAGAHARSAIGVSQLPFGVAVEVEAVFEI